MLTQLPISFRTHPQFSALEELVADLNDHRAMQVEDLPTLENMIRMSLLATICFYGHLMGCVKGEVARLTSPSLFAVAWETRWLDIFRQMLEEEITATNIPTESCLPSPHFVPMYEAARAAGLDLTPVDRFLTLVHSGSAPGQAARDAGFCAPIVDYFQVSSTCAETYRGCVATVMLRENTLSSFFQRILDNKPPHEIYDKYGLFLSSHVSLDSEDRGEDQLNHGQLMVKVVEEMTEGDAAAVDHMMNVMVEFYRARRGAYDACLQAQPIF